MSSRKTNKYNRVCTNTNKNKSQMSGEELLWWPLGWGKYRSPVIEPKVGMSLLLAPNLSQINDPHSPSVYSFKKCFNDALESTLHYFNSSLLFIFSNKNNYNPADICYILCPSPIPSFYPINYVRSRVPIMPTVTSLLLLLLGLNILLQTTSVLSYRWPTNTEQHAKLYSFVYF